MIIKINKRVKKYIFVVFVALLISIMFHVERYENMDFNRFQDIMDTIRYSNMSFQEFLSDDSNLLKWLNRTLPYMYSFDLLIFLISKCFENNYVMVWVSIIIDYAIIAYIAYDWRRDSRYRNKEVVLSILACFALLPMIHACSGLRTATSACFMSLAIYKFLYRNKNWLIFALYCAIAITFHPATLMAVPIAVAIKVSPRKIVFYITLLGCLFVSQIATFLSNSGNLFLQGLGIKYATYTSENQFRAYRFAMYGVIVFAILIICYYFLCYRNKLRDDVDQNEILTIDCDEYEKRKKLFLFYICYLAFLVGNANSYEIVCRGAYLIGASAPVVVGLLFDNLDIKNRNVAKVIKIMLAVLLIYMCFSWIRYYAKFFF